MDGERARRASGADAATKVRGSGRTLSSRAHGAVRVGGGRRRGGWVTPDTAVRLRGRGTYVSANPRAVEEAVKRKKFELGFKNKDIRVPKTLVEMTRRGLRRELVASVERARARRRRRRARAIRANRARRRARDDNGGGGD